VRKSKPLPTYSYNGWVVDKRPNSFAERYLWTVTAVDRDGYWIEEHGFNSKRDALAFAAANEPPQKRHHHHHHHHHHHRDNAAAAA